MLKGLYLRCNKIGRIIRLTFLILILFSLFLLFCWHLHYSYYHTIYNVQTIDLNILHSTLPIAIANILNRGDEQEMKKVVEINYSRFGILIVDPQHKRILSQNKFCEAIRIEGVNFLDKIKNADSYDDVISPESIPLARIYYFRSLKPKFMLSFLQFLKNPIKDRNRDWKFTLLIYCFIGFLVFAVMEEHIQNNSLKEQLLLEKLAKLEKEYNILQEEYDSLLLNLKAEDIKTRDFLVEKEKKLGNSFEALVKETINKISKYYTIIKHNHTIKEGEIDHLLVCRSKSVIFILEDKGYAGLISGSVNSSWKCKKKDGREYEIKSVRGNPYQQVRGYVMGLKRVLEERGIKDGKPLLIGVVIFPEQADLSGLDLKELPKWYSVIKLNELNKTLYNEQMKAHSPIFNKATIQKLKTIFES